MILVLKILIPLTLLTINIIMLNRAIKGQPLWK